MAKRRKKKEPEEERGVPQASQEEFSSLAALDPPPQYGPKVDITVEVNGKPLRVHPELYKLFPHRNPTQLEELRNSMIAEWDRRHRPTATHLRIYYCTVCCAFHVGHLS